MLKAPKQETVICGRIDERHGKVVLQTCRQQGSCLDFGGCGKERVGKSSGQNKGKALALNWC